MKEIFYCVYESSPGREPRLVEMFDTIDGALRVLNALELSDTFSRTYKLIEKEF